MTVTVYTKPSCVQCTATYRALDNKHIRDPRRLHRRGRARAGQGARLPPGAHHRHRRGPLVRIPPRHAHRPQRMKNVLAQTEPVTIKRGAPVELVRWRMSTDG